VETNPTEVETPIEEEIIQIEERITPTEVETNPTEVETPTEVEITLILTNLLQITTTRYTWSTKLNTTTLKL